MTEETETQPRGPVPLPGTPGTAERLARILRVDHAGEHGAVRIYEGQLAVLGRAPRTRITAARVREMAAGEEHHLAAFNRLLPERGVRPTALMPLWNVAGFALGAATALMGEKAAMACTAAVEEVIEDHYQAQIDNLGEDEAELKATLEQFRDDEAGHRHTALEEGAEEAPGYGLLSAVIKAGCRAAIRISERV